MQIATYAELLEEDQEQARGREREALERSISLMELAEADGGSVSGRAAAIAFTSKLWGVLLEDLASSSNGLPKQLRAQIISIGIWIMRELELLRGEDDRSFDDVIVVSRAIRDGLA